MPLSNACFISFRHGERELTQRFVREFYEGLAGELETHLGREVGIFLDERRLQGGDFFNEQIAKDLCNSGCLIIIYTPTYFSLTNSYCAREYRAMLQLEQERLALLTQAERNHGLIIPVVFRGSRRIPSEIKNSRQCYDFSSFTLTDNQMSAHPKFNLSVSISKTLLPPRQLPTLATDWQKHNRALISDCTKRGPQLPIGPRGMNCQSHTLCRFIRDPRSLANIWESNVPPHQITTPRGKSTECNAELPLCTAGIRSAACTGGTRTRSRNWSSP